MIMSSFKMKTYFEENSQLSVTINDEYLTDFSSTSAQDPGDTESTETIKIHITIKSHFK